MNSQNNNNISEKTKLEINAIIFGRPIKKSLGEWSYKPAFYAELTRLKAIAAYEMKYHNKGIRAMSKGVAL